MSEADYDKDIAPELKRLGDRCAELGMPFLAVVEYEPGSRGRTVAGMKDASLDMLVINLAAQTGGSIDDFMLAVARHIRKEGIPHSCIALERIGVAPNPKDRKP